MKKIEQGSGWNFKEKKLFSYETVYKEWQKEKKWLKKHPQLAKLKTLWWLRYGIKNKIEELPGNIRAFIQRGKRGWADSDIWSFDSYLSTVIMEGLIHLKKYKSGVPTKTKYKCYSKKEWNLILDKMIQTFKIANKQSDSYIILTKKQQKEYDEGFKLFHKHFFNLWD